MDGEHGRRAARHPDDEKGRAPGRRVAPLEPRLGERAESAAEQRIGEQNARLISDDLCPIAVDDEAGRTRIRKPHELEAGAEKLDEEQRGERHCS